MITWTCSLGLSMYYTQGDKNACPHAKLKKKCLLPWRPVHNKMGMVVLLWCQTAPRQRTEERLTVTIPCVSVSLCCFNVNTGVITDVSFEKILPRSASSLWFHIWMYLLLKHTGIWNTEHNISETKF